LFDELQVVFLFFIVFVFNRMRHKGLLLLVGARITVWVVVVVVVWVVVWVVVVVVVQVENNVRQFV